MGCEKACRPEQQCLASHLCTSPPRGCQQSLLGWRWRMPLTPRRADSRSSERAISGGPNALGAPVSPSSFPTGAFGRGRSQPWTRALSPRVPFSLLSSALPPPAAARLTGGATSAWLDKNKTNLSYPRCLQLQKLPSTYWLAEGRGLLGLRALRRSTTPQHPARLARGGRWQWAQDPSGLRRLGSAVPGGSALSWAHQTPRRVGLRRGPEQMQ